MQIEIATSNDPKVPKTPVEITDPIEMPSVGRVVIEDDRALLHLEIEPAMEAKGITKIKRANRAEIVQGQRALELDTNKGRVMLALAPRPAVDLLLANRDAINMEIDAVRQAVHAAARQADLDRDRALRRAMYDEAAEIAKKIPAGHIQVTVTKTGSYDGDDFYDYFADGTKLSHGDIDIVGWANAIRPGAWGAFDTICVASISPEKLADVRAARAAIEAEAAAKTAQVAADRAAKFAQARTSGQPVVLTSYSVDCNDRRLECSTDIITVCAMPDGTTHEDRVHTY